MVANRQRQDKHTHKQQRRAAVARSAKATRHARVKRLREGEIRASRMLIIAISERVAHDDADTQRCVSVCFGVFRAYPSGTAAPEWPKRG